MKQFLCLILCLFFVSATVDLAKEGNGADLFSSTGDEVVLKFDMTSYQLRDVMTPSGKAASLEAPGAARILVKGAPELSRLTAAVVIPDKAKMKVEVIDSAFIEINNVDIAPSKGVLTRDINPAHVPYEYGSVYKRNAFYPGKLAELGSPYIIRDFRGQTVIVNPFQYNPVTKVLRVYSQVTVKVSNTGLKGENILERGNRKSVV